MMCILPMFPNILTIPLFRAVIPGTTRSLGPGGEGGIQILIESQVLRYYFCFDPSIYEKIYGFTTVYILCVSCLSACLFASNKCQNS